MRRFRVALLVAVAIPGFGFLVACPPLSGSALVPCALKMRLTGDLQVDVDHGFAEGCGPLSTEPAADDGGAAEAGEGGEGGAVADGASEAGADDAAVEASAGDASATDAGADAAGDAGATDASADAADEAGASAEAGADGEGGVADADGGADGGGSVAPGGIVTFQWGSTTTESLIVAVTMPVPAKDVWSTDLPATVRIVDGDRSWETPSNACKIVVVKATKSARYVYPDDRGPANHEYDLEGEGTCFAADGGGVTAQPTSPTAKKELIIGDFAFRVWYLY